MATGVQQLQRGGTAAEWSTANPVLAARELGVTTDTRIIKIGDGVNAWNDLDVAFDGRYLPLSGTAANSELLEGISADSFLKVIDSSVSPENDSIVKRTSAGRIQAVSASADADVVNLLQAKGLIASETIIRAISDGTSTQTLASTDVGRLVVVDNSSLTAQRTINLPLNAADPIAVGSWIDVCSSSTGNLKIGSGGGITLLGTPHVWGNFSTVRLLKTGTDTWLVLHRSNKMSTRHPRIRAVRTGSTGYTNNTYIFVPYDSIDTTRTFNPDNEWFALPGAGLPTGRRIIIQKDGEYEVEANFISSVSAGTTTYTTINIMTADNSHTGERILAMMPTDICCHGLVRTRLAAGDSIGVAHSTTASGSDVADGGFGGYRNDLTITRVGD